MNEIFPIVAGVVSALVVQRVASNRLRAALLAALSLAFGLVAGLISGELAESWAFLLVDTSLVLVVAVIALGALAPIFVLVRAISIPDEFFFAGRGVGLWISLIASVGLIGAGLLQASEEL